MTTIFTVGHSRHAPADFLALLRAHEVELLVDVRSSPRSRAPHFDKLSLEQLLVDHGCHYAFLGRQLGGRPDDRALYRDDGSVDYALRAAAPDFVDGILQLVALSRGRCTAILCAEEDPARCHRRLLVAPALVRVGVNVGHIRGDGRLEPEEAPVAVPSSRQLGLFGDPP